MSDHEKGAAFDNAVDAALNGRREPLGVLPPDEQEDARALLRVADLLWEEAHGAPPLREDPVAAMLGLVPDASRSLDPNGLRAALSSASLKVSDLARRLSMRGWQVSTRDVFNWQSGRVTDLAPALIRAIADATDTAPERLTASKVQKPEGALVSVVALPRFRGLVERWARVTKTSLGLAESALESRLAAAVYRGSNPDGEHLLDTLEAVVEHLEGGATSD